MWTPTPEQAARVDALGRELHAQIRALWQTTFERQRADFQYGSTHRAEIEALYEQTLRRVAATFPTDHPAWVDFLCFPLVRRPEPLASGDPEIERHWTEESLAYQAIGASPTPYAVTIISARLQHMLRHMFEETEVVPWRWDVYAQAYRSPQVKELLMVIARMSYRVDVAAATAQAIVNGDWNYPVTPPVLPNGYQNEHFSQIQCSYQAYADEIAAFCERVFVPLHRTGYLTFERFAAIIEQFPKAFPTLRMCRGDHNYLDVPRGSAEDEAAVRAFTRQLAWETVQTLDDRAVARLGMWSLGRWEGSRWLVKACEHIERLDVRVLRERIYSGAEWTCRELAEISEIDDGEERAATVATLRTFKPATLQMVLPFADGGQSAVLDALGWSSAAPLITLIHTFGQRWVDGEGNRRYGIDLENSSNPESCVVDRDEILSILRDAGDKTARAIFKIYRRAKTDFGNTLTLIEAVPGWNAKVIPARAARLSQIALKAIGVLPITRGEEEVQERYLLLKQAARDLTKFKNKERQAFIKASVQAGVQNLATTAGYRDLWLLERRMLTKLGDAGPPIGVPIPLGHWKAELTLDGGQPTLIVCRGKRPLAKVPAGLRRDAQFLALKARADELRAQRERARQSLERAMVDQDMFSREDLVDTEALAIARGFVTTIVWRTRTPEGSGPGSGYGMYEPDTQTLRALDGSSLSLDDGATVAHPHQLATDGVLDDWRQEIGRRGIQQPFEQLFRQLYLLTSAERDAPLASARFADRLINPEVFFRLANERGWRIPPRNDLFPVKVYRQAGVRAQFLIVENGPFLFGTFPRRTGAISFVRTVWLHDSRAVDESQCVPLDEVSPIVCSEVMRDADHFVTAAQASEPPQSSEPGPPSEPPVDCAPERTHISCPNPEPTTVVRREDPMERALLRQPGAFVPVVMSTIALAIVIGYALLFGTARQADEGTAAHLWQLLMVGQLPVIALFVIKWLPIQPRQTLLVIALQIGAACAAAFPVWWFQW